MKNLTRLFGIAALVAVIGFSFVFRGDKDDSNTITVEDTIGKLTITGIPARLNNSWVLAF